MTIDEDRNEDLKTDSFSLFESSRFLTTNRAIKVMRGYVCSTNSFTNLIVPPSGTREYHLKFNRAYFIKM